MTNNTITVMKKELARFFGDRRLVITTLLLPGIMIYVVYSFLGSVMMKTMLPEDTYVAKAYVVDMPDSVREEMRELRVDWQQADREQLRSRRNRWMVWWYFRRILIQWWKTTRSVVGNLHPM